MIEPNRLSAPGEHAARARVEAVFELLDEWGPRDLARVAVGRRDTGTLAAGRRELERVARTHGRGGLLDEARHSVRDRLLARMSADLVNVAGVPVTPPARPDDVAALIGALQDAVDVAVVEDVLDPDVADELANAGRALLGLPPLHPAPAPAGVHHPTVRRASTPMEPTRPAAPAWEPSDRDWAESAHRPGRAGDNLLPGVRGLWVAFVALLGVAGVIGAVGWGIAEGSPWIGVLGAAAVVAVAWTLASYRRSG